MRVVCAKIIDSMCVIFELQMMQIVFIFSIMMERGSSRSWSRRTMGRPCDRRSFSTRCQCIGTKETERCGTTLFSSALLFSLYAAHRIFFSRSLCNG